jgi:hypothetical protein
MAIHEPFADLITRLGEACLRYTHEDENVVVAEPYLPFIPEHWNGTLVLAEAQNLSASNAAYVQQLSALTPMERVRRLRNVADLGVQPWDDGSLKLAVLSVWPENTETYAVSNAVLWSIRDSLSNNANPTAPLVKRSISLWGELFSALQPKRIVAAGSVARTVVSRSFTGETVFVRLPSPRALSPISGMLSERGLLAGFPSVAAACKAHPELLSMVGRQTRRNKILYACHFHSIAYASVESPPAVHDLATPQTT